MAKRNVDLEQEMSDDRENFEPVELSRPGKSVAVMAPPAMEAQDEPVAAQPDFATLVKALAEALSGSTAAAITATKEPKRINADHEYHRKSVFNEEGDLARPKPLLECPTLWAILDEEDPSRPPAPYIDAVPPDVSRVFEIEAANQLQPVSTTLELNDGQKVAFVVYVKRENGQPDGRPLRKLLGLPKKCYGKDLRNSVPNLRAIARQVSEQSA
jgi:hypothetical protein